MIVYDLFSAYRITIPIGNIPVVTVASSSIHDWCAILLTLFLHALRGPQAAFRDHIMEPTSFSFGTKKCLSRASSFADFRAW